MSLIGAIALAAAERLESAVSAAVALRSYQALLSETDRKVRLPALLGALRCAVAVGDERALGELVARWASERELEGAAALTALCVSLAEGGHSSAALRLAGAEVERFRSARALYLLGRLRSETGALADAVVAFGEAWRLAAGAPAAGRLAAAAGREQLRAMVALGLPDVRLVDCAARIELESLAPEDRLFVLGVRLRAAGKYARAQALAALGRLAESDASVARAAVVVAARHADTIGTTLSWVEADRIAAVLGAWPDEAERARALAALGLVRGSAAGDAAGDERLASVLGSSRTGARVLAAARALAAGEPLGAEEPAVPADDELGVAALGLEAVAALQSGQTSRARGLLARLRERIDASSAAPAPVWTAALLGLGAEGELGATALALVSRLLAARSSAPPRGLASLALRLAAAGATELSLAAWRAAAARDEPGAREALVDELTRRGTGAHAAGDRLGALRLLREARALATR